METIFTTVLVVALLVAAGAALLGAYRLVRPRG